MLRDYRSSKGVKDNGVVFFFPLRDNVFLFVLFLFLKPSNDHRVMLKSNHKGVCGVNMVIYVHCLSLSPIRRGRTWMGRRLAPSNENA